jgi:hypothetical protein
MNKRKRIIALENRIEVLEQENKKLETRVEVVDFKERAKDAKYVIEKIRENSRIYPSFVVPPTKILIKYLSEIGDKVITAIFPDCREIIVQNGKYLEFWRNGKITSAMRVFHDKLVEMDVDVYKKAFPERANEAVKINVNFADFEKATKSAKDAADSFAEAVRAMYKFI